MNRESPTFALKVCPAWAKLSRAQSLLGFEPEANVATKSIAAEHRRFFLVDDQPRIQRLQRTCLG